MFRFLASVPFYLGEAVVEDSNSMLSFVKGIMEGVTGHITLATVATVVATIIGGGIISIFAWKFARKGYAFIRNALSGKSGKF